MVFGGVVLALASVVATALCRSRQLGSWEMGAGFALATGAAAAACARLADRLDGRSDSALWLEIAALVWAPALLAATVGVCGTPRRPVASIRFGRPLDAVVPGLWMSAAALGLLAVEDLFWGVALGLGVGGPAVFAREIAIRGRGFRRGGLTALWALWLPAVAVPCGVAQARAAWVEGTRAPIGTVRYHTVAPGPRWTAADARTFLGRLARAGLLGQQAHAGTVEVTGAIGPAGLGRLAGEGLVVVRAHRSRADRPPVTLAIATRSGVSAAWLREVDGEPELAVELTRDTASRWCHQAPDVTSWSLALDGVVVAEGPAHADRSRSVASELCAGVLGFPQQRGRPPLEEVWAVVSTPRITGSAAAVGLGITLPSR